MRRESGSAQPGEVAPPPAPATLIELLSRNALQMPRVVALREKDLGIWQEYTWRQYLDEVLALALRPQPAATTSSGEALYDTVTH